MTAKPKRRSRLSILEGYEVKLIAATIVLLLLAIALVGWSRSKESECESRACPEGQAPVRLQAKCYCLTEAQ